MSLLSLGIDAVERGLVPDWMARAVIRRLCGQRLRNSGCEAPDDGGQAFLESLRSGPIALVPEKANEQHYELPPDFFVKVLGPRCKYSCCYWSPQSKSLAEAEAESLRITCQRADLNDGQQVLELGCGWGSLSLWMAEHYRSSQITAVSNSADQRRFIAAQAAARRLENLQVITADMNNFSIDANRFDRIVSVEMFEHLHNVESLLERIASWLRRDGKLFVHHFCHRRLAYRYQTDGDANWMGRYFFTGGMMPNETLLSELDRHMTMVERWRWEGTHYVRTAEAWLANLDAHRREVMPILVAAYGAVEAQRWYYRWRIFFLAVAELFGYANGNEWFVSQSLLVPTTK